MALRVKRAEPARQEQQRAPPPPGGRNDHDAAGRRPDGQDVAAPRNVPPISPRSLRSLQRTGGANCSKSSFDLAERASGCVIQSAPRKVATATAAPAASGRPNQASVSIKRAADGELVRSARVLAIQSRPALNQLQVNRQQQQQQPRWESSTSALNGAAPQFQARGRWCCELPHRAAGAHSAGTRRQGNLSPLLNKVRQERDSLRGKRAASSLTLASGGGGGATSGTSGTSGTRQGRTGELREAVPSLSRPRVAPPTKSSVTPQSAQVTNSRLRQGALFARRQLHLLPAQTVASCNTVGTRTPPPPPADERVARGQRASQLAHSRAAPASNRTGLARVQPNPIATRTRQLGQATTAAEARRRATRQMLVVANAGATTAKQANADPFAASQQRQRQRQEEGGHNFQLMKAEKEASRLTSSSSSLSLNAFVVKRARQQQHSSSSSSSCSSIGLHSRRWSTSSADSPAPPASQASGRLTGGGAQSATKLTCPLTCDKLVVAANLSVRVRDNKSASEHAAPRGDERSSSADEQRREPFGGGAPSGSQKTAAGLPKQHFQLQLQLQPLDQESSWDRGGPSLVDSPRTTSTPLQDHTKPLLIDHSREKSDKSRQAPGNEHAFSLLPHAASAAAANLLEQEDLTTKDRGQLTPLEQEDVDIVAIGCSPVGFVSTLAPLLNPNRTSQFACRDQTAAHNASLSGSTQENEYQPLVEFCESNNYNQAKHRDSPAGASGADLLISASLYGENCTRDTKMQNIILNNNNNNINVGIQQQQQQQQVSSMQTKINSKKEPMLPAPIGLPAKSQATSIMSREPTQTQPAPATPKNQPLGLHQSMNITAAIQHEVVSPVCKSKPTDPEAGSLCCALDLTIGQKESVRHVVEAEQSSPNIVQEAVPLECQVQNSVVARPKSGEIPIRLEPICDFYDLETRPFARGKFAQVKRCTRKQSTVAMTTGACYAAKCIKKRRRLVDIKHEILLEIEALRLSYETKHIVRLFEVYETTNEMILILEMANGGELQRVLDDEEQIEESLVRKMIDQILEGLVHLHDNEIVHLDIKPQNLLLSEPFPNGDIKLCDFGISRRISKDCEIREICGTPDYVAPEILRYDPISLATDMWSLGVLTYVLLSGYSPFGSESKQQTFCNITQATLDFPQEIFDKISDEAVDFIRKLIVREPTGRLTSRQAKNHHWISNHRS